MSEPFEMTDEEIMQEELWQANDEVRRLRRGITRALRWEYAGDGDRPVFPRQQMAKELRELIEGDAANPLRPEWDHHREDAEREGRQC